jgi:hypothetical protein
LANSPFQFYVARAGIYPFRLMYYQSNGGASLEWFIVNPDGTRTLVNAPDGIPAYYQRSAVPATTLAITRTSNGVSITFTGTLQSADSVTGTWTDVPGTSPLTVPTTGTMKFYRSRQ